MSSGAVIHAPRTGWEQDEDPRYHLTLCGLQLKDVIWPLQTFREQPKEGERRARFGAPITCKNCLRVKGEIK